MIRNKEKIQGGYSGKLINKQRVIIIITVIIKEVKDIGTTQRSTTKVKVEQETTILMISEEMVREVVAILENQIEVG